MLIIMVEGTVMEIVLTANDFPASTAQKTIPSWVGWVIVGLVGAVGGGLARRIPKVRGAKPWQQWVATPIGGALAGGSAWLVAYYVFNVDLP